ncbi:MAG: hypothetical protein JST80_11550 [Bdellovibrionales bacterium]|nr:hypothetical protein [Bdellovibrionales bacterium]
MVKTLLLIIATLSFATESFGGQNLTLVRMARTTAMGGAGVGLADDENALFQNVAGLAGQDDRRFKLISAGLEASWDTYETFGTSMDAINDFSVSSLNKLMGKDINFRVGQTAMVILPHFELAYLVDVQGSINEYNLANPNFDFGYQTTHGVQAGTAWKISKGRHPSSEWRVGAAAKVLWRKGGYYNIQTSGFLQATNQGKAYIDNLVGNFGMGFGADVGVQYVDRIDPKTTMSMGLSILDIGDTRFSDDRANPIPMSINWGLGYKKEMKFGRISLGFDIRDIGKRTPFVNKTHLGGEFKLPTFDFWAGFNQLNYSWGFGFDLWVLKISLLSTAEELGYAFGQNTSRRYMLMFEFNLPM